MWEILDLTFATTKLFVVYKPIDGACVAEAVLHLYI